MPAPAAEALSTQGAAAVLGASDLTGARYDFGEAELRFTARRNCRRWQRICREFLARGAWLRPRHDLPPKIGWDPCAGDERGFFSEALLCEFARQAAERRDAVRHSGRRQFS